MSEKRYAVALVRSSSTDEYERIHTVAEQQEEITAYADAKNIEILKVFTSSHRSDGVVGEMINFCKSHTEVEYLLIEKPSRLTRNIVEYNSYLEKFSNCGVEVLTTIENLYWVDSLEDTYRDYFSMALAGIDSRLRSERVKSALLNRTKAGYCVVRPPLGYERSRIRGLYEKTNTAHALRMYFTDTLAGAITIQELRQKISQIFFPSPKLISPRKLKDIVSNPYYAGFVSYNGQQFDGLHEPILTPKQQQELINLLNK